MADIRRQTRAAKKSTSRRLTIDIEQGASESTLNLAEILNDNDVIMIEGQPNLVVKMGRHLLAHIPVTELENMDAADLQERVNQDAEAIHRIIYGIKQSWLAAFADKEELARQLELAKSQRRELDHRIKMADEQKTKLTGELTSVKKQLATVQNDMHQAKKQVRESRERETALQQSHNESNARFGERSKLLQAQEAEMSQLVKDLRKNTLEWENRLNNVAGALSDRVAGIDIEGSEAVSHLDTAPGGVSLPVVQASQGVLVLPQHDRQGVIHVKRWLDDMPQGFAAVRTSAFMYKNGGFVGVENGHFYVEHHTPLSKLFEAACELYDLPPADCEVYSPAGRLEIHETPKSLRWADKKDIPWDGRHDYEVLNIIRVNYG